MTNAQAAAYVAAQTALLNAEIAGMIAENEFRTSVGQSIAYAEDSFAQVRQSYAHVLEQRAVIELFHEAKD